MNESAKQTKKQTKHTHTHTHTHKWSYPRSDAYSQPSKNPETLNQDKLFIYTKVRSIYPAEKPLKDEAEKRFSLDQKLLLLPSIPPPTLIQNQTSV